MISMRSLSKLLFPEKVFNEQLGILKVKRIKDKKFILIGEKYYELIPQTESTYKIFSFFINLAGEVEFKRLS